MTEQEKIDRGQQAAALLEHPLVKEALGYIADMCLREFAKAAPDDADALRHARYMLSAANEFRNVFARMVAEGRNAATKADHVPQEIA